MLIKFMVDFQGRETKERFFEKGEVAEIADDEVACDLVRRNVAQVVDEPSNVLTPIVELPVIEVNKVVYADAPKKKVK